MHVEDLFTQLANQEIIKTKETVSKIYTAIDALLNFADSQNILEKIGDGIDSQFKQVTGLGDMLKKDLDDSEKVFDSFEITFENDYRLGYLHIGLLLILLVSSLVCVKIWRIEKVHTIT